MEIINLADRRKSKEVPIQAEPDAEHQENIIDFLATTMKCVALDSNITEAVVFLKDPSTGGFMPGATSQAIMDELLGALGSPLKIQAMPEEGDEG